jgi:RNA polymerase sigma-70 factor (ECF subfamily)
MLIFQFWYFPLNSDIFMRSGGTFFVLRRLYQRKERMKDKVTREFQEFWNQAAGKVRAYMFCSCRNWTDAEDLAQDCCLRALRAWGQFDGRASRQAWLFGIARRTRVDWFRRKKREIVSVSSEVLDNLSKVAPGETNIDMTEKVWRALEKINTEQSEVIHLRFAAGLNYIQIARALGIPIGTVRSRLYRGLKAIKENVGEWENGT